ncbi:uncharacterized protein EDB91DRAFT_1061280, partial [Suillus paluster]|uniref:uncharacterized protein n=1 Tax=Suillus paluster TaxID=48578 RepID=UPI001B87E96D
VRTRIFASLSAIVVHGALFDSPVWGPPHKRECLDGTRETILGEIKTVLQASNSTLVWLSGSPGTGKSAIAHTIARHLKSESRLAGTFFFSRKHKDMPDMASLDFFAATLAYQISKWKNLAKDPLVQAIRSDPAILDPRKPLDDQIQELLIKPLENLEASWGRSEPKVLVIDAVDACEEDRIYELISCLSTLLHQPRIPRLHIVITGCPLRTIDDAFAATGCKESIHHIALDNIDVAEIHKDCRLFFKNALERSYRNHGFESGPEDNTICRLADRANGRFGTASTIMRFLDTRHDEEDDFYEKLDVMKDPGNAHLHSTIFRLYEFIINSSENPSRAYRHLSTVANLAEPLAIFHLRKLLGCLESDFLSILASLSPIVSVPVDDSRVVEVLHIDSLRTFLSRHVPHTPQLLARSSLRIMNESFLHQSCFKDVLQRMMKQVPETASEQNLHSSSALEHACQYWSLYLSQAPMVMDGRLRTFLRNFWRGKLLSWFERQWYVGGLESCIAILDIAQTIDFIE